MNRLQKKCLVASMALHALLCVILIVGPAFLSSKQKDLDRAVLEVVPDRDRITDAPSHGGGNPNAIPPSSPRQIQPAQSPPPAQQAKTPKSESRPPPEPKTAAKPEPDIVPAEIIHEKPKPQIKVEKKVVKRPANTAPDQTPPRPDEEDAKAKARAEAETRRRTAQQILARINDASERLENLSSSTRIEPLGPGGDFYANYGQVIVSIYKRNWMKPAQIEATSTVETTITVARNGKVLSARIVKRSGNPAVDKSVQKVLDEVISLPPFPDGSTDQTRTFEIEFELNPNRLSG